MVALHFIQHSLLLSLLFFEFSASKKIESTQLETTLKRSSQKIIQSSRYIDPTSQLSYVTLKGRGGVSCVGGLIAPDTIMTTARCVSKSDSNTILQPEDISIGSGASDNKNLPLFNINAQKIIIHPSYTEKTPNHVNPSVDSLKADHYYLQPAETSDPGSLIKILSENLDSSFCGNTVKKYTSPSTACLYKKGISNSANRNIRFLLSNDQKNIIGIASDIIEDAENLNASINENHNDQSILDSDNAKNKEPKKSSNINVKSTTIDDILVVNLFNDSDLMFINANVPCSGSMCDRNIICDKSTMAELPKKVYENIKLNSKKQNSSNVCEISLDPVYLKANNGQQFKGNNINTSNSIFLPCSGLNFQLSFNVAQISDILFTIENNTSQKNSDLITGKLGIVSGQYNIEDTYTNLENSNNQDEIVKLKIELINNTIRIYKNNITILVSEIKNKSYKSKNADSTKITLITATKDTKVFDIRYSCLNERDNCKAKNIINKRSTENAKNIENNQHEVSSDSIEELMKKISATESIINYDENLHERDVVDSQKDQSNTNGNKMCDNQLVDVTNLPGSSGSIDPQYDDSQTITIPCNTINFQVSFDADISSDLYFILTGHDTSNSNLSINGKIGVVSGDYSLNEQSIKVAALKARSAKTRVTVIVNGSTISINVMGKNVISANSINNNYV
ncbi:hypothetical protein AYI69_g6282, partial [Smittium culicis]